MTDAPLFFVPRTGELTLSTGGKHVLVQGVRELPDAVANDPAATRYGVKPVHEMTADERAAHGLPEAAPDVDESIKAEPEGEPKSDGEEKGDIA